LRGRLGTIGDTTQRGEPVVLDGFGGFSVKPSVVSSLLAFFASKHLLGRVSVR
jgi:hypothetical protein